MDTTERGPDPAADLAVLHVVVRVSATNSQYNEHCLPVADTRRISICSLFPAEVAAPDSIAVFEGDGTVRGCFRALRTALTAAPYDVVHVHAPASGLVTIAEYLRSRRPRRDLVFTVHSSWEVFRPRNRMLLVVIAAYFPLLVACGDAAARSLPRLVRTLAGRLEVVPNGVDLDRVDRVLALDRGPTTRRRSSGREIASVIRTRPIKDPGTLVDAFIGLAGRTDRLVLVGAPTLPDDVSRAIAAAGVGNRVRVPGVVARDEVYRVFRRAALFASTSRGEGLPVSVLEAMACRCPVVLSDIPPHRDIARLAPEIPVVAVGDAAGFTREMDRLLRASPSTRRGIGDRLRRCVVENFSVAAMNARYGELYRDVAVRNGVPSAPVRRRVVLPRAGTVTVLALVLGALAGLGYGVTHPAEYVAATTLVVGADVTTTVDQGSDERETASDAPTIAFLARRQVVLEPVARSLGLADWRPLQGRVTSDAVGGGASAQSTAPSTVQGSVRLLASGATAGAAERLAAAVGDQVVLLTTGHPRPVSDPVFLDREAARLDAEIAHAKSRVDRVLGALDEAGPGPAGRLWARLGALRVQLGALEDRRESTTVLQDQADVPAGVQVTDRAAARRTAWPPDPWQLALLGAAGGLVGVAVLELLARGRRSARAAQAATSSRGAEPFPVPQPAPAGGRAR